MRAVGLVLPLLLAGCPKQGKVSNLATPEVSHIRWSGGARNEARISLGRTLFFEPRLSATEKMSCATCHRPEMGFSDGHEKAIGVNGDTLPRHTPSLFNLAWSPTYFWDGRATSLEEQARGPLLDPKEMGLTEAQVTERLRAVPGYAPLFSAAFGDPAVTMERVTQALADFQRSLVVADTPFDRHLAGDESALSAEAKAGLALFVGKADCILCHSGPNFTDGQFHNTGVPNSEDLGRHELDLVGDFHQSPYAFLNTFRSFKTPGLRNIDQSPPYMHNGSIATLEAVVDFYDVGGRHPDPTGRSRNVHPLQLSEAEKTQLLAFLKSLSAPLPVEAPTLP